MNNLILVDASYTSFYRFFATLRWFSLNQPDFFKEKKNDVKYDWSQNEIFIEKYEKMYLESIVKLVGKKEFNNSKVIFCLDSPKNDLWRTKLMDTYKGDRADLSLKNNFKPTFKLTYDKFIPNLVEIYPGKIFSIRVDKMEADAAAAAAPAVPAASASTASASAPAPRGARVKRTPGLFGGAQTPTPRPATALDALKLAAAGAAVVAVTAVIDGPGITSLTKYLEDQNSFTKDDFVNLLTELKITEGDTDFSSLEVYINKQKTKVNKDDLAYGLNNLGARLFILEGEIERDITMAKNDDFAYTANNLAAKCFTLQGEIERS
jgi:hypothetical protein